MGRQRILETAMSQMSVAKLFQFAALTIASGAAGWAAYLVPSWNSGNDPCLWAAVATVIMVVILWRLFLLPVFAPRLERRVLAGFLVGMPIVYLVRCLSFADHALTASWLWIELLGLIAFTLIAILGLRGDGWFLAFGIIGHGIAWDLWHYRHSSYIPDWYSIACMCVDFALGAYVATRISSYRQEHQRCLERNFQ
jgi:hypothetical protein